MKISFNDFLLSHKKTAGLAFVEKIFELKQEDNKPVPGKTFCLTQFGAEVHVGEPLVAQVKPVETLKEKIARFERLERNMNMLRMRAYHAGALQFEDDSDDEDFDFANDNSSDIDAFGDPFQDAEDSSVAEPEKGAGEPAQLTMPVEGVSPDEGVPTGDASPSGMPSQPNGEDLQK